MCVWESRKADGFTILLGGSYQQRENSAFVSLRVSNRFKVLFFVLIDGWNLLIGGLIRSFV